MHRGLVLLVACGLWGAAATAHAQPSAQPPVARVFDREIGCGEPPAHAPQACGALVLRDITQAAARRFIERHALSATDAELRRLEEYNRAFERHDRSQRSRKLAEIEQRLADTALGDSERLRLEEFRTVLQRLARYETDVDAGAEPREPIPEPTLRAWIESAKLERALYDRYGGSVGLTAAGPYAHGAMNTLLAEHLARGEVVILDAAIARYLGTALQAPPKVPHPDAAPDFTPYWERPIPSSYLSP